MDFLQYAATLVVALIVTLGILVTVHEYGHYVVARWCGVRVLRFCVGMGPVLFSRRDARGTEFAVAALPIGGYVRMLDSRETTVAPQDAPHAFDGKSPLQRIAIALGGPVANFLLAIVVGWLIFVTGTSGQAPIVGVVDEGSLADRAGVRAGAEILAVDGEATRTWQAVNIALVKRLGDSGEIEIDARELGGREVRYRIPVDRWLSDAADPRLLTELGLTTALAPTLGEVIDDSAADRAGLRRGDRIVAVDGVAVTSWGSWVELVRAAPEQPLAVRIERDGRERDVTVTPARVEEAGEVFGQVGVRPHYEYRQASFGPLEAIPMAIEKTGDQTLMTLDILRKMVGGRVSTSNLSGPITIAKVAGQSAMAGLERFLELLALLSVSLAVLNLLPIPVLDGGHILFHTIELVKGSPVSERVQLMGVQVGLVIVAGMMMLALFNDFARL